MVHGPGNDVRKTVAKESPPPQRQAVADEPFGPETWLANLTAVAEAMGDDAFETRLFELLARTLHVDHCVVFTYSPERGPGHLFTRSIMPDDEAEGLARDYVSEFYRRDPHFHQAVEPDSDVSARAFRPRLDDEYDADYQRHFFREHNLVDKISTIRRVKEGSVYCNFWRMGDSGPYNRRDEALLQSILPLVTSLIANHFRLRQPARARNGKEIAGGARSMVHSIISRGVPPFDRLTGREAEVCERILIGYTSTGISLDLNIKPSSVNTYRRRAYEKLGIATQNELFALCLEALESN